MANELIFDDVGPESKTGPNTLNYRVVVRDGTELTGQIKPEQFSLTFPVQVRWFDVWAFARDMLGTSKAAVSGGGLIRTLPEPCPYPLQDPDNPGAVLPLYCVELNLLRVFGNGFASDTTDPNYDPDFKGVPPHPDQNYWPNPGWAELQATFAAVPYPVLDDTEIGDPADESKRFTYTKTRYASENERVPGGSMFTTDGSKTYIPEGFTRRSSITQVDQFFVNVPAVPDANIEAVSGGVNKAVLVLGGRSYPIGCVQFDTYDKEQMFDAWANEASHGARWKYVYKFLCREDGRSWNQFRKPDGTLVGISHDGTAGGQPPFRVVDMTKLYKFT
jgi:hypothetical protein